VINVESASAYIPVDRRMALSRGEALADRTSGAALFADVSGFTPLTEALVREMGPRRGAEELTRHLNAVYGALIHEVRRHGGSVVSFAGDAITCWFDGDDGLLATSCALTMQRVMRQFTDLEVRSGGTVSLAIKAAVAVGPVRRFLVGDPTIQLLDVLAGSTLDRMARTEKHATKHEVVLGPVAADGLAQRVQVSEWREGERGERFAVVTGLTVDVGSALANVAAAAPVLEEGQVKPWILQPIYERLEAEQERFLAELRPGMALFCRFGSLEYDVDEEAGTKLDAYVRWVQSVLARYEGYLLQLIIGDKGCYLYAAFGAPVAHDDDAARAVAAALELRSPPEEMGYIADIQIGVSQGQMRSGAYGGPDRRTYGVLGDEVTAAARLMGAAKSGQVLTSKRVADAAAKSHSFEYLGAVQLKGKKDPLPVYLPLERQLLSPQRPATLFRNALVGRDAELARMEEVLESAMGGHGQILCLEGAAGVGKSHLTAEYIERAIRRGLRVALGACQSTSQGIAYTPWRQAFRALLDLAEETEHEGGAAVLVEVQMSQVEAFVRRMNPDWLVRLPLLGDLLDLPIPNNETTAAFDPQLRQESLFALAVEIVHALADVQPVMLVVEDTHWMDEASIGLTVALGRVIASRPILLVSVQRPPLREGVPHFPELERLPYYGLIDLDVLSPTGIAALVADRLQGNPSALALSLIQAQAQGNPFFTEELVDALYESGKIRSGDDGTWTLAEPLTNALREANCLVKEDASGEWIVREEAHLPAAELGIPDSIHGIVLSRIDRLPELHKLTLKVASVIGRTFEFGLLAGSHPLHPGPEALLEQIEVLQSRDFTRLEMPQPQRVYLFKHNITQEVVYRTLLEEQRLELHQAVGEALESLFPDAVERLAYHYGRSGVRDKTLFYLDKAAEKAQREYANETALNYYSQALALEERWEWRKGQVEVLHILGRRDEERGGLDALQVVPEAPVFDVSYLWGQYYEALGDYAQAQTAIERALGAARRSEQVTNQARCLSQLGLIARRQGDYERAKTWYDQALTVFKGQDARSDQEIQAFAQALNGLGTVYRGQGDFERARDCYERALALGRTIGDRWTEAEVLGSLGGNSYYQRRFTEALAYHGQALDVRRAIGDRDGEGKSLYDLAACSVETGEYGQAEKHFADALAIQQAIGNRYEEVNVQMGLGFLYQYLGVLPKARDCLEQGLRLAREIGDENGQAYILGSLGLVMREQGELEAAEKLLSEGLALAQAQADKYLELLILSQLGIANLEMHRLPEAISWAESAVALGQETDQTLGTTTALAACALAHLESQAVDRALACAKQAKDILDECGGEGAEYPQRDYLACYRVLDAAGQAEEASAALRAAHDLVLARAGKIHDPALRRSFLEKVSVNRQVLAEAARAGISQ
jgi:adenylate cyclase